MVDKQKFTKLPIFDKIQINDTYLSITLDSRKGTDGELPSVARIQYDGAKKYFRLGKNWSIEQFSSIITTRNRYADERVFLREKFNWYVQEINALYNQGTFSLDTLKERITGKQRLETDTIYIVWDNLINDYRKASRIGTADSYLYARNRFSKDMGECIKNTQINKKLLEYWITKMKGDMSSTSIGIYLRAFRVVVKKAVEIGLINESCSEMFKGVSSVNDGRDRRNQFLDANTMKQLYDFFLSGKLEDQNGLPLYEKSYNDRLFNSLGMFLFSYLANGMNMADVVRLRYDNFYFDNKCRMFRFVRHKTANETQKETEILIPIIPQIKAILDKIGNPVVEDGLVFPILKEHQSEERINQLIEQTNSNIRDRMAVICNFMEFSQTPTPTWCRHSYATNLRDASVPIEYISSMMGHTISKGSSTTLRYLSQYNYRTMVKYNSLLFGGNSEKDRLIQKLSSLSENELKKMLYNIK